MEGIILLKRSLMLMLVLLLAIGMLAGCSSEPAPATTDEGTNTESTTGEEASSEEPAATAEQVLVWNIGSEPKTIDPGLNAANDGGNVVNNMFEGLVREVKGKIEPAMAASWEVSEDKLVYTFKLRDGLKWSNGEPLTAKDFEYSWNRVLAPETASEYSWIFDEANVDSFTALDDSTFEVTLKAPTPYFLGLTAFYTFFPVYQPAVEAGPDGAWATDPELSVVNGPFMLESYTNADKAVLVKNPNYWRADQVKLDKIEALMIVDEATALTGYESGQIDVLDQFPTAEIPRLLAEDPSFMILPQDGVYYYALNTAIEPLDDVKVRKALALAIDRTAICETVAKGGQIPATTMVSQAPLDHEGNIFAVKAGNFGLAVDGSGVEEAKALLAEAGYPNGEGFPKFTLLYNTNEGHKAIAEAIQEMWKQNLNIDISLENQEWAVFQDSRKHFNYEIARCGWIGDYSDPMTYLGMFLKDSPMNYAQWHSDEYDALIEAAKTQEPAERFATLYKAHEMVMNSYAYLPIYYYTDPTMVSDKVSDWEKTTRNTFFFGFTSVDK